MTLTITPILVPSVKHNCHYNHIQSQFFSRGVRLWNVIPCHLAIKPSLESFRTATFQWISPLQWCKHPGTNTWCLVQNSAYFVVIVVFSLLFAVCIVKKLFYLKTLLLFFFLLYMFNVCLHNYWHLSVMGFIAFLE